METRDMRHARYLRRQAAFSAVEGVLDHLPPDDALRVIADVFDSILVSKSAQDNQDRWRIVWGGLHPKRSQDSEEKNHHPDVTSLPTE